MNFKSDNVAGAAPEVMEAVIRAGTGAAAAYGDDPITAALTARFEDVFGCRLAVFPVATGTGANALALATLAPPHGAIYCHCESHVNTDECGAPEFFSAGAKLMALPGPGARIEPPALEAALAAAGIGVVHHVQPAVLSLTQATEAGTVYRPDALAALAAVARRHGLAVHMDGARFANAVVRLGCSPAALTWQAGVDVLSFGATKNGALAAEAVVVFRPDLVRDLPFRRKRGGHLLSKMRFVSAQLAAMLEGDLWLRLAAHANAMADRLAAGLLAAVPGARLRDPVEANAVFVHLPEPVVAGLLAEGFAFYRWRDGAIRLVTSFATEAAAVDAFVAAAGRLGGTAAGPVTP